MWIKDIEIIYIPPVFRDAVHISEDNLSSYVDFKGIKGLRGIHQKLGCIVRPTYYKKYIAVGKIFQEFLIYIDQHFFQIMQGLVDRVG